MLVDSNGMSNTYIFEHSLSPLLPRSSGSTTHHTRQNNRPLFFAMTNCSICKEILLQKLGYDDENHLIIKVVNQYHQRPTMNFLYDNTRRFVDRVQTIASEDCSLTCRIGFQPDKHAILWDVRLVDVCSQFGKEYAHLCRRFRRVCRIGFTSFCISRKNNDLPLSCRIQITFENKIDRNESWMLVDGTGMPIPEFLNTTEYEIAVGTINYLADEQCHMIDLRGFWEDVFLVISK